MRGGRKWLFAILLTLVLVPAQAQQRFDRPGGDYSRFTVTSGDPADCVARCEREARCRAWTFSYPGTARIGGTPLAVCWLKSEVRPSVENACCVSGVKGAALTERRPGPVEVAVDRSGGDYRQFDTPSDPTGAACRGACEGEARCRAWTYMRPGYGGAAARCFLKDRVTAPRRKPCCVSGVVR